MKKFSYKVIEILTILMIIFSIFFCYSNYRKNYLNGRIRINTASKKTLREIKCFDEKGIESIIKFRPITNKVDLVKMGIINKKQLDKISNKIVVQRTENHIKKINEGD